MIILKVFSWCGDCRKIKPWKLILLQTAAAAADNDDDDDDMVMRLGAREGNKIDNRMDMKKKIENNFKNL